MSDEWIKKEMLAQDYLRCVESAIQLLHDQKLEGCLLLLKTLKESMEVTLALGEMYDIEQLQSTH